MKNLNIATVTYQMIKKDIIEMRILPGAFLVERQLAEDYASSRTPVREAIKQLEQEGWLEGGERKRHRVKDISLKYCEDLFEAREMLEIQCIENIFRQEKSRLLAGKLDSITKKMEQIEGNPVDFIKVDISFHTEIVLGTGNEVLARMWDNLSEQIIRLAIFSMDKERTSARIIEEHYSIVNALWNDRQDEAKQTLVRHFQEIKDGLKRIS